MKLNLLSVAIASILIPAMSSAMEMGAECGDLTSPILSAADYNGDGLVNIKDLQLLNQTLLDGRYYALYDRNADGELNYSDKYLTWQDMGASSTPTDQQLAKMYQRFKHIQTVSGFDALAEMNYLPLGGVLAFHGQHWMNTAGQLAVGGLREADPYIAEGINVVSDGGAVPALFWGEHAVPLFNDPSAPGGLSTLDWPDPAGIWNFERVQAFADSPPDMFPETEADQWHTHAGTCLTVRDEGDGPEWFIDQHLSNAECQALPNLQKVDFNGQLINLWGNFWMLHVWMFDLNPNGAFGNVHPCIDPDGPSEDDINGGREVPPFFQHHHG